MGGKHCENPALFAAKKGCEGKKNPHLPLFDSILFTYLF
jgi:hypothetical protein